VSSGLGDEEASAKGLGDGAAGAEALGVAEASTMTALGVGPATEPGAGLEPALGPGKFGPAQATTTTVIAATATRVIGCIDALQGAHVQRLRYSRRTGGDEDCGDRLLKQLSSYRFPVGHGGPGDSAYSSRVPEYALRSIFSWVTGSHFVSPSKLKYGEPVLDYSWEMQERDLADDVSAGRHSPGDIGQAEEVPFAGQSTSSRYSR